ncbi:MULTISPECIES: universal stress protein [Streptomyces]|uniref:Universal stress protein n=1 Tax=Streptomyces rubrolavendulae TaxID=285473 RepID=A0A1D8G911_9ACTN|nr:MULTISPECIES: universal stress protein [Streptomyces]AOT61903.1 Universal stress protein [Streptomyces rubrolavendulae]UQS29624.1 universal stress protein [Streptomyces fradiae]
MTGTITAGVDGTAPALAAVDWAADEAERRGARLRLVHAWTWRPVDVTHGVDRRVEEDWVRRTLAEAEARVRASHPGLDVTAEVLDGDPVPSLVAETGRSGTLVLGSRGHGTLTGYLLGSVSLHVLRQAEGPVVMVRAGDRPEARPAPAEVVAGVQEPGAGSDAVLDFAFSAAAARGVPLRAVHVWNLPASVGWSPASLYAADQSSALEEVSKGVLTDILKPWRDAYPQVEVVEHCEFGSASEILLSLGGSAHLLAVGRRGRGEGVRRLGSVTHAVLHHATAPVAVVPHD